MTDHLQLPDLEDFCWQEWQDLIDGIPAENLDFDDFFFRDLPSQTWSPDFDKSESTMNVPFFQSHTPCTGPAFTSNEPSPLGANLALANSNSTEPLWELVPEAESTWCVPGLPGQFDGDSGVTRHYLISKSQTLINRI